MLTVSVVIPVYRAEQTLLDLYRQLSDAMSEVTPDFEIIFVEDAGGDGSWPIIAELARTDQRVRGFRMSRNYGQHNALLCGIRAAKHGIILTMDDDLQHPVTEAKLLRSCGLGYNFIALRRAANATIETGYDTRIASSGQAAASPNAL